ncbi:MAG: carboxylating nicotinate-nucleotide diphosphorylase [Nanoarchaeota archaeon]|nr:carboxylating nicotinate-nucleotide diphosphorylase [Nanoarchaeota archaeon]MBU1705079.1 carboxylating nicotinate-nucleotide diphosphorylase [Nanoarchaeota archaeon]
MERKEALLKAYQRGHLLNLDNPMYLSWIKQFIVEEIKGDVGSKGDITSNAVLIKDPLTNALIYSREHGIVSGIEEVMYLYQNNNVKVIAQKKDGDRIRPNEAILNLKGKEKDLLRVERSALDILQRMSGIATLTSQLISHVKGKVAIAPTRKTQWRYLDKKAVFSGGGLTHRLALWESILIKDNHLKAVQKENAKDPITECLQRAWKHKKNANFIEIEVQSMQDAIKAATVFLHLQEISNHTPCIIMLDNMSPKETRKAVKELKRKDLYNHILLEASGKIRPNNILSYANTDVDVLSLGYLTHSSRALDIKQKIL